MEGFPQFTTYRRGELIIDLAEEIGAAGQHGGGNGKNYHEQREHAENGEVGDARRKLVPPDGGVPFVHEHEMVKPAPTAPVFVDEAGVIEVGAFNAVFVGIFFVELGCGSHVLLVLVSWGIVMSRDDPHCEPTRESGVRHMNMWTEL